MTYLDYLRTLTPRVLYWREQGDDIAAFSDEDEAAAYEAQYLAATLTCRTCGDMWHPESEESSSVWTSFHSQCAEAPCDLCGQPTNTPDACFECYHAPFGVGWEQDAMERMFA